MKIYCLYDRVSGCHADSGIFLIRSDDEAKRSVKSALAAKQLPNTVIAYPKDFDLVRLGELDSKSGIIDSGVTNIINLGNLAEELKDGERNEPRRES